MIGGAWTTTVRGTRILGTPPGTPQWSLLVEASYVAGRSYQTSQDVFHVADMVMAPFITTVDDWPLALESPLQPPKDRYHVVPPEMANVATLPSSYQPLPSATPYFDSTER